MEIFTTKLPGFSYEKKWRIFYTKGKLVINNVRCAIKETIFGHDIALKDLLQVKEWISDLNGINLFTTEPVRDGVGLKIVPYVD